MLKLEIQAKLNARGDVRKTQYEQVSILSTRHYIFSAKQEFCNITSML
jgi:hypothetical protein